MVSDVEIETSDKIWGSKGALFSVTFKELGWVDLIVVKEGEEQCTAPVP